MYSVGKSLYTNCLTSCRRTYDLGFYEISEDWKNFKNDWRHRSPPIPLSRNKSSGKSNQKLCKSRYESFLILPSLIWFPNIGSKYFIQHSPQSTPHKLFFGNSDQIVHKGRYQSYQTCFIPFLYSKYFVWNCRYLERVFL